MGRMTFIFIFQNFLRVPYYLTELTEKTIEQVAHKA